MPLRSKTEEPARLKQVQGLLLSVNSSDRKPANSTLLKVDRSRYRANSTHLG
jgi:hypothetical protein